MINHQRLIDKTLRMRDRSASRVVENREQSKGRMITFFENAKFQSAEKHRFLRFSAKIAKIKKNGDPKPENRSSRVVREFWGFLVGTDFLDSRSASRAEC